MILFPANFLQPWTSAATKMRTSDIARSGGGSDVYGALSAKWLIKAGHPLELPEREYLPMTYFLQNFSYLYRITSPCAFDSDHASDL
jgi:hypothetical protein